jgi:cobalt/nickel transport system permease protein
VNIQIDTLAYTNRLRHLPASQKLCFALVLLLLASVTSYPVQIAIFLWMSVWVCLYAGIPRQVYTAMLLGVTVFTMTSLPALVVEYAHSISPSIPIDTLWQLDVWDGKIYLSHQGALRATQVVVRCLASTSVLFFIVLTIPAIDLARLCQQIGCPAIIIELSLLIYRCIFLLAATAQIIVTAQVSRGGYRTGRPASRYQQLSLGIAARGFNGEFRFWQPVAGEYSARYARESIAGCLLLVICEIVYRSYV